MFTTEVTRRFGTRLLVVAGGLMWLANADYVSAADRARLMAYITAASFPEEEALRQEIRRCHELCDRHSFGVNVSMLARASEGERVREVFEVLTEEGVRFVETSGRNPEAFLPLLKSHGITVTHKVASVKHAVKAQKGGVGDGSQIPAVQAMERESPELTIQDLMPYVAGRIAEGAYGRGDWRQGLLSAGEALVFVDRIEPISQIVQRLEGEMREAMVRLHTSSNG